MEPTEKEKIDPLKLYFSKDYYRDISEGPNDFPTLLLLDASSLCNYTCIMCKRGMYVPEREETGLGNGHMSLSLVKKLVEECRDEKSFLGFHFAELGEPLMNPDIVEMVAAVNNAGMKTQIVTNGYFLNDKMIKSLIEAGLTKIKISFQGATEEKYRFWRNNDYYPQIVQNVHRVVELRDEMKSDLFVQVGTSSCDDTMEELENYVAYWEKVVDHVYWNYTGLLHIQDDSRISDLNVLRKAERRIERCKEPFVRMAVLWDGRVTPCPSDESTFVGDLNKQTIREVWQSKEINKVRKRIIEHGNVLEKCQYCIQQPKKTLDYTYRYDD